MANTPQHLMSQNTLCCTDKAFVHTYSGSRAKDNNCHINQIEVNKIFEKKFHYQRQPGVSDWTLPPPKELFYEYYQFESLQQLKSRLNSVKCKLNDYTLEDWSLHTRRQDPSNEIPWRLKNDTNAEFVTIAWCKFFECLHSYPLVKGPQLNSLHLCELPGAFINALNHYLYSTYKKEEVQWRWLSTTLNPYYEGNPTSGMISDDRFMFHTFDNWLMHNDFTGNIISRGNIEQMQEQCIRRLEGNVQLITADGSIDCADAPDCQEEVVAILHFAEITAALSILAEDGCFVLKMFTFFESSNVCKLFFLNCVFEQVHVFKPATSKRGNSEVYVICLGYKKQTKFLSETLKLMKENVECTNILPLFPRTYLPKDFMRQHEICARLFMNLQIESIESNIQTYKIKPTRRQILRKQTFRTEITNEFHNRYKVRQIAKENTILYGCPRNEKIYWSGPFCRGSYSEREIAKGISMEERIFALHRTLNNLEKLLDNRYGVVFQTESAAAKPAPSQLHVYRGAPFIELYSSLFAHPYVMQLHQKLQETLCRDPMCLETPICKIDGTMLPPSEDVGHNFSCLHRIFFINILETICETQPRQLVFSNAAFLTHLSVSILRFLSLYIFEHLIIRTEPKFQIRLHTIEKKYATVKLIALRRLHTLLVEDSNVLCVMAIGHLHRNDFAKGLMQYNNQLLMKTFKLILNN